MKTVLLTNYREPQYIHRCIESIRKEYNGVIDLMISGKRDDYLSQYQEGFIKHHVKEEGLKENWKKACKGYASCVALGEKEGVLVIEDDTALIQGWYAQFIDYINTIKDKKFVLSLGDPVKGSVINPDVQMPSLQMFLYRVLLSKNPISGAPPEATILCWHDSHAVYYPPTINIPQLVKFLEHFGVEKTSMHDLIVGHYLYRYLIPIWISVPRLAINIGAYHTSVGPIPNVNSDYSDWDYA